MSTQECGSSPTRCVKLSDHMSRQCRSCKSTRDLRMLYCTTTPVRTLRMSGMSVLDRLGAYRERFPHLKKRNNVTAKSGVEDILDELHYCEVQLGSKQDGSMGCTLLHGTMVGVESFTRDVWNPMGLRLTGLGQITKDNMSEFEPIVDELMIKYGAGMYMSVEMRLAVAIGATVLTVHGANSGDPRIAAALEKMNRTVVLPESGKDL